jgi:hypothetical protein
MGELLCRSCIDILGVIAGEDDSFNVLAVNPHGIELLVEVVLGRGRDDSALSGGRRTVDGLGDRGGLSTTHDVQRAMREREGREKLERLRTRMMKKEKTELR